MRVDGGTDDVVLLLVQEREKLKQSEVRSPQEATCVQDEVRQVSDGSIVDNNTKSNHYKSDV